MEKDDSDIFKHKEIEEEEYKRIRSPNSTESRVRVESQRRRVTEMIEGRERIEDGFQYTGEA
jgi:hypothetical protein